MSPAFCRKHGIDRALVLSRIPEPPVEDADERESLRKLVDRLPPRFLRNAKTALEHLQGLAAAQPGINDLWQGRPRLSPEAIGAGAKRRSRRSSRVEEGVDVVETHYLRDGIEITLIERFRPSEDGKTLSYAQEITGPGKSEQHTIDFELM